MIGIFRRSLRLDLVRGLAIALALPALSIAAANAQTLATETTLSAETRELSGRTQATISVAVSGADGLPATGVIAIDDNGRQLAGVTLNAEGRASVVLDLTGGEHLLSAVYAGDATHIASLSQPAAVSAVVTGTPDFQVSVAPLAPATLPLTLIPGNAGTVVVTITPENNAALTGPMFVTLSCSGLPDQASCAATPENLEILPTTPATCPSGSAASLCPPTSMMVIQTQAASRASASPQTPIAWAILLPGALGLGGLAWGARRRKWLCRLSLVVLVGIVTLLGTTGCNPRYGYKNHPPLPNPATPAGTYTVKVTAQSTNGVTATTHIATFVLTVK